MSARRYPRRPTGIPHRRQQSGHLSAQPTLKRAGNFCASPPWFPHQCEAVTSRQTFSPRARNCHAGENAPEISSFRERSPKPSGKSHVTYLGPEPVDDVSQEQQDASSIGIDADPRRGPRGSRVHFVSHPRSRTVLRGWARPGPSPQLLRASTGLLGAKAAVNLDSPDPTIAVNAFASYQTNDVTESDFQIQHVAPGAASGAQSK